MYRSLLLAAGLACGALLTAAPASAQIVFTLNNVSLGVTVSGNTISAGSLTGSFTSNSNTLSSASTLLTYNIVAPSTGVINGHAFAGFDYTPTDSTAIYTVGAHGLLTGFELDAPGLAEALRFYFSTNLSTSGQVSLNTAAGLPTIPSSYENEQASGGNRYVESGTVSAAPEPSSWMMGFFAAALFAGLCLRKRTTQPRRF